MTALDPRLHAIRPDLADAALAGSITAPRFAEPRLAQLVSSVVPVCKAPRFDAMQLTQALLGETVKVFDEQEGWAWVQLLRDGYVGYVNANALSSRLTEVTHHVDVPSTFIYPEPSLKTQPAVPVTLNAGVTVSGQRGAFSQLSDGRYIFSAHLRPTGTAQEDFVTVAGLFRHVPYYWGGKSVYGLDCSGLVQLSLEASGRKAPRDSDMQEAALGRPVAVEGLNGLQRGDLVFWQGHVGIMTDAVMLLHANGHHMMVVEEPLALAAARIGQQYGPVTSVRRLQ
ncbi:C40 family peptidase [Aestuariivirga sp.]|jgi:cell wall-associated NlpC family hydrolase|uniref:C40 family peptidase n=1 Tax=Aestuariivirga sp. TaxID=2650926 RepID=UPI003784CB64